MGNNSTRVRGSMYTSSYFKKNSYHMSTDQDGYSGVTGRCIHLPCGYCHQTSKCCKYHVKQTCKQYNQDRLNKMGTVAYLGVEYTHPPWEYRQRTWKCHKHHDKFTCNQGNLNCLIDWCCSGFYYFVRNSLVTLLKDLCARIFFFTFVNISEKWI